MKVRSKECTFDQLPTKLRQSLGHFAGQRVLFCHVAECTLGVLEKWDGMQTYGRTKNWTEAHVITETTLASSELEDGKATPTVRQLDLSDFSNARDNGGPSVGYYLMEINGKVLQQWVNCRFEKESQQNRFMKILRSAIAHRNDARSASSSRQGDSPEERLRSLARLRDEGLITEAEYQQKRAALLLEL